MLTSPCNVDPCESHFWYSKTGSQGIYYFPISPSPPPQPPLPSPPPPPPPTPKKNNKKTQTAGAHKNCLRGISSKHQTIHTRSRNQKKNQNSSKEIFHFYSCKPVKIMLYCMRVNTMLKQYNTDGVIETRKRDLCSGTTNLWKHYNNNCY